MTTVASAKPSCAVCGESFGFFSKRHPACERKALLRRLDVDGALSHNRVYFLGIPGWKPIDSPPTMYTLNGIGTTLYGQRDEHARTMTATVTLYATFVFVPLVPIAVYRVVVLGDRHYSFLAKRWPERSDWVRVGKVWLWIFAVYGAWHLFFG